MARSNIFPGNQEIVEVEEEFTAGPQYRSHQFLMPEMRREENDRRSLASNAGNISSLEEDLNQLFEIFNRRASSNGSSHQNQAGTSKRSASKKSLKAGGAYSPAPGTPERTNLKQALRGLCLSQASEMAAMKRSMKSPRSSEAGRIMAMYRNVVVEDSISNHSQDDNGGGVLEISLLPELSTFDPFQNVSEKLPSPDLWPSNRISIPEKTVGPTTLQNDGGFKSMYSGDQPLKPEKSENGTHLPPSQSQKNCMQQVSKCSTIENGKPSPSVDHAGLTESSEAGNHASPSSPSRSSYGQSSLDPSRACSAQSNSVAETVDAGTHNLKIYILNHEKNTRPRSCSDDSRDKALEHNKSSMTENVQLIGTVHKDNHEPSCSSYSSCDLDVNIKTGQKEIISVPPMVGDQRKIDKARKKSLKAILSTGSAGDEKVSRSTRKAYHSVKPLVKTKSFVKRRSKKKMASDNSSKSVHGEFNNDMYSTLNPIVCPNCQCNMTAAWNDSNKGSSLSAPESVTYYQDFPISPFASLSGDVSSGNVIFDFNTPELSSDGLSKSKSVLVESSSNSKSRNKEEFTQSSKSSPDQCSTSTSVSEGSNMSRLSFCDRPHMSKDIRWEAIRHVKLDHGTLGLNNFSLLKKLGCGDIGTVYLAELIGTDCLFAIKVMDNDFLARRKKITRAKTEKEILRMLDHPFLPTLYCQFTTDNLSCLVMEYCPGGDLHVLRQRQPGRCFTEQAARFYVAEVLLALEYLHMLGVVYRDLKPENILVREDGHIMLSDFDLSLRCAVSPTLLVSSSVSEGSKRTSRDSRPCVDSLCIEPSCQVTCFTPRLLASSSKSRKTKPDVAAEMRTLLQLVAEPTAARSNSFVGTHEYLSPEIIKGEGHGSAVDWWTFGIFLYELLYGKTPFKGPGNEETMANVVLQNLRFPDSPLVSLQARDLIAALLVKEPENRLGTERGATEIKQHPFFDGLNWALIRCAVPPELPESQGYGMPKPIPHEKKEKYLECSSGSGSAEHLEFEVF